jgi:ribonuclease HII
MIARTPYRAGVDEAGRGPLAGSVVAAAVVLDPRQPIAGLDDSKKLSAKRREQLAALIMDQALAWKVVSVAATVIDDINILQATLRGMQQAIEGLSPQPSEVLIDGNHAPLCALPVRTIVGGDRLHAEISAASILAKVSRDRELLALHAQYPEYGFDRHKGYPTADHLKALSALGPCPAHRRSFAPVRRVLAERGLS